VARQRATDRTHRRLAMQAGDIFLSGALPPFDKGPEMRILLAVS
jgi:hypothetical protein